MMVSLFQVNVLVVLAVLISGVSSKKVACNGKVEIKPNSGSVMVESPPKYPGPYPANKKCTYDITCKERKSTKLDVKCTVMDLQPKVKGKCVDFLQVTTKGGKMKQYCGKSKPNMKTTDGFVRFHFRSNNKIQKKGFRCFVSCKSTTTTTTATTTVTTTAAAAGG